MKYVLIFLTFATVSCAHRQEYSSKAVISSSPGRQLSRSESSSVRLAESIKAYPLGRYVDPNQRGIMHESHTIYRVESTPKWNLSGRRNTEPVTAASPARDEWMVELNRQREATKNVIQSGRTVTEKMTELAGALQHNQKTLAEQNGELRREVQTTRERMNDLEKSQSNPPQQSNSSEKTKEEPW